MDSSKQYKYTKDNSESEKLTFGTRSLCFECYYKDHLICKECPCYTCLIKVMCKSTCKEAADFFVRSYSNYK